MMYTEYEAASETLETAREYVVGSRSRHYGHPLDNHTRTAILMNAYLRVKASTLDDAELLAAIRSGEWLEAEDVCWLNVQQKISRDMNVPTPDTTIDVAGYAANVAEVRAARSHRADVLVEELHGTDDGRRVVRLPRVEG